MERSIAPAEAGDMAAPLRPGRRTPPGGIVLDYALLFSRIVDRAAHASPDGATLGHEGSERPAAALRL